MSTVKRKYEYYDQGVLPEEGEYGITYLTLYSSTSGNIYDGWIYDPDNKIPVSATERTFGYRNPRFPQYCWDDEVIVDLSNPQSREESDFTQGRIVSFNTNVSPYPIVLQDIDVTEMTESERERHATTVLFTAIPLVSDAYIQAQVEVQCKCNLSPDNTSGEMRIEAFYILNDESDRTMRPNPIHTFTVSSANERHTLPWLYFNPALKHEDNNYIGVKLICTGGTAEIGISDAREYGDAIITLTSAGLTGDKIDDSKPVSIWIEGEEVVAYGHKLDINEYDVFCEYDDGSIYLVTHFCEFTPAMGERIYNNITLYASYNGLTASMFIHVAEIESIELTGLQEFLGSYTLDINDFNVIGYFENGDCEDITDRCVYSPAMQTTITQDTTLTASILDPVSQQTYSDSLLISKIPVISTYGSDPENELIYTLYENSVIEITGNANSEDFEESITHLPINIPGGMDDDLKNAGMDNYLLKWSANGNPSGINLSNAIYYMPKTPSSREYEARGLVRGFEGFDNLIMKPMYEGPRHAEQLRNYFVINLKEQKYVTSSMLNFLKNVDFKHTGITVPIVINSNRSGTLYVSNMAAAFENCSNLTNLSFLSVIPFDNIQGAQSMFAGCTKLNDISALTDKDVSNIENSSNMFTGCISLKSAAPLYKWKLTKCKYANYMFSESGIESTEGLGSLSLGRDLTGTDKCQARYLFYKSSIRRLSSLESFLNNSKVADIRNMCSNCKDLENITAVAEWKFSETIIEIIDGLFSSCDKLEDISPVFNWTDLANSIVTSARSLFAYCPIRYVNGLMDVELVPNTSILSMFAYKPTDDNNNYIPPTIDSAADVDFSNCDYQHAWGINKSTVSSSTRQVSYVVPGYSDQRVLSCGSGAFAGMDIHYFSGGISYNTQTKIATGTLYIHFIHSSKLPMWYMQELCDCWDDYYRDLYTKSGGTYAASVVIG